MGRILDWVVLGTIGQVNRLVFGLSRGRVVLYRFRGIPEILLAVATPADPLGRMVSAACLLDDNSYVVLARPLQEAEMSGLLGSSTGVKVARWSGETAVPADLDRLTDPAERAAVLKRALSRASIEERAEARRLELTPVARLRLHHPLPETSTVGVAIVLTDPDPPSGTH